jgi:peptidoglycan/xylan/chitin deacetylase (PgdA/CDA1 family)
MSRWWIWLVVVFLVIGLLFLNRAHFGVIVLHYHAINDRTGKEEIIAVRPEDFAWHMEYLKKAGYNVIPLKQAVEYLSEGTELPRKAVTISFDDGYMDNYKNAFPILKKHNYPATVFVATGEVGGINRWDLGRGFAELALMDWDQIITLEEKGIAVMPHTVHHVDLTTVSKVRRKEEINLSKKVLEDHLGREVTYFSYPDSGVNDEVVAEVKKAGFGAAFTSSFGTNVYKKADLYRIRRMPVKEIHKGFWGRLLFVIELKLCSLYPF